MNKFLSVELASFILLALISTYFVPQGTSNMHKMNQSFYSGRFIDWMLVLLF